MACLLVLTGCPRNVNRWWRCRLLSSPTSGPVVGVRRVGRSSTLPIEREPSSWLSTVWVGSSSALI